MALGIREDVAPGKGYQDLVTWQKVMDLVDAVYLETRAWPREELYGLTAQVRKAAVAIPSNLAEGHGRSGAREFAHHASIAYGSLCEVETQIAKRYAISLSGFDDSSAGKWKLLPET